MSYLGYPSGVPWRDVETLEMGEGSTRQKCPGEGLSSEPLASGHPVPTWGPRGGGRCAPQSFPGTHILKSPIIANAGSPAGAQALATWWGASPGKEL